MQIKNPIYLNKELKTRLVVQAQGQKKVLSLFYIFVLSAFGICVCDHLEVHLKMSPQQENVFLEDILFSLIIFSWLKWLLLAR